MSLWSKPGSLVAGGGRGTLLERAFDQLPIGLMLLQRGLVASVNQAFASLLGSSPSEIVGRPLHSIFAAETGLGRLPTSGSSIYELKLQRDGNERAIELNVAVIEDQGYVLCARDVTREREHEREILLQREFLRTVVDTVPGFVFVKDRNSRFLLANRALADAYGTTTSAITGKSDADFNANVDEIENFRRDDREVIANRLPKLILSEKVTYANGDVRWLTTVKVPIVDEFGNCSSLLAVATDITDLRRAQDSQQRLQEQMLEAQKLESLGVLAGGIAHDFNNLLLAVLGSAEAALVQLPATSPVAASVQRIRKAAMRAAELTNQLLAYSGKGHFVVETVDLNALVRDMAELLDVTTGHRAQLEYAFENDLPGVTGDVSQIRQVVMNLITNAVDAMGDSSGVVTLTTGLTTLDHGELSTPDGPLEEGDYVFLRVRDTGSGIEPATVGKIFEPFFTTKFAGRGLGLAAVLGIVRGHQGAISVETEVGKGSTFTVYLPASGQPSRVPSRRIIEPALASGQALRTVLVIDDEELICFTTRQLLELLGYRVLTASDGNEAFELLAHEAHDVDAVLLDLTMPMMPADEVLRRLQARNPAVRVLLMSGYDEQEIKVRLGGGEISGFLQKPFTLEQLNTSLQTLFAGQG